MTTDFIARTLCKKIDGGRIAAFEVLIATHAISNLIREGKTFQRLSARGTGWCRSTTR